MINKILKAGRSFYSVCRYVCHDPVRVEILSQKWVREDYRLMARDFNAISKLCPRSQKPVFHAVLDFLPEEKVDDDKMLAIAEKYLDALGMSNTQHVFAKHIDKAHPQVHIIANRIDREGKYINNSWEIVRSVKASRKLIEEYKLIQPTKKHLQRINLQALYASDAKRLEIYQLIRNSLPGCRNLPELEDRLLRLGVATRYRYNKQTGQPEGMSFRYDKMAFRGGNIDRSFALHRLEQTLAQQQQLYLWEQEKLAQRNKQQPVLKIHEEATTQQQEPKLIPNEPQQKPAQRERYKLRIS